MNEEIVNPEINREPVKELTPQPEVPEDIEIKFYIFAKDQQKLNDFIEMAYILKLIPEQSLRWYMKFCLDCAAMYVQLKVQGK